MLVNNNSITNVVIVMFTIIIIIIIVTQFILGKRIAELELSVTIVKVSLSTLAVLVAAG